MGTIVETAPYGDLTFTPGAYTRNITPTGDVIYTATTNTNVTVGHPPGNTTTAPGVGHPPGSSDDFITLNSGDQVKLLANGNIEVDIN